MSNRIIKSWDKNVTVWVFNAPMSLYATVLRRKHRKSKYPHGGDKTIMYMKNFDIKVL